MQDLTDLAVGWFNILDFRSIFERDPLVPETDAENGDSRVADDFGRHTEVTGICRVAGSGGNDDSVKPIGRDPLPRPFVVPDDNRRFAGDGRSQMCKIPGERIVVVDYQKAVQEPQHDFVDAVSFVLLGPR